MLEYLTGSGLPDVEIRVALSMCSLHLGLDVNHDIAPCWWISRTMAAIS